MGKLHASRNVVLHASFLPMLHMILNNETLWTYKFNLQDRCTGLGHPGGRRLSENFLLMHWTVRPHQ